jgi:hypothetical protein
MLLVSNVFTCVTIHLAKFEEKLFHKLAQIFNGYPVDELRLKYLLKIIFN